MPTLATDVTQFNLAIDRLTKYVNDAKALNIEYQKLIAETVMIRLFYSLEAALEQTSLKIACNVPFLDGTSPKLLIAPFKNLGSVKTHMLCKYGKNRRYLNWTTLKDVKDNLDGILDHTDHFITHRATHDGVYESMRNVRNHIAHCTITTKKNFTPVVRQIFLGNVKGISTGKLLVSRRPAFLGAPVGTMPVIEQYLVWSKVFVKTLVKI